MPTLVSSSNFTVLAPSGVTTESTSAYVLPTPVEGFAGLGRLVHPTLGTLDYPYAPDEWEGIDTDILAPPVWASAMTLTGAANTVWAGQLRDVTAVERWTSDVSMPMEFVRMLLAFWMNPPAPDANSYVHWYPQYTTTLAYRVAITSVGSEGGPLKLTYITRQNWLEGVLELKMKVLGRV